jgi:hypothetical protein
MAKLLLSRVDKEEHEKATNSQRATGDDLWVMSGLELPVVEWYTYHHE